MELRPADESLLPALTALEQQCFSLPWSEASFRSELTDPDGCILAAVENNALCGFAVLHRCGDEGELYNIAVDPAYRRRGIGRSLLTAVIGGAETAGLARLYLEVRAGNEPAKALYAAFGFEPYAVRRNYYQAPVEDAILMQLPLGECLS